MTSHRVFLAFLIYSTSEVVNYISASSGTSTDDGAFSCSGKVIGGYYADIQDNCQMFHVCTIGEKGEIRDIVFRCLNGTVFDQETRVCERQEEVDCSKTLSFYYLNNELYGPGIIPAGAQIHGDLQQTLTHKDTQTPNRPKSDTDYQTCSGVQDASLLADTKNKCKTYRVCLPASPQQMMERTFICIDDGFSFDHKQGKCSRGAQCHSSSLFSLPDEKKKLSILDPLRFCNLVSEGSYILDTLSDCEQFLQCPHEGNNVVAVKRCPPGALFSQEHGSCVEASQVDCKIETYSLLRKLSQIEHILSEMPEGFSSRIKNSHGNKIVNGNLVGSQRSKRSLIFENRNPHREATNGALTNVAGVISDHAAVIDARSSGNVLDGTVIFPEFSFSNFNERLTPVTAKPAEKNGFLNNFGAVSDKDFAESISHSHSSAIFNKDQMDPLEVQPQTSLAFNKTDLNGTVIEVSEIASPHKHGKVTITSIVPKFVRQNGSNGKKHRTSTEETKEKVNGSKINLVGGVHHPFSPVDKDVGIAETIVEIDTTTVNNSQRTEPELTVETENATDRAVQVEETTVLIRDAQLEERTSLPETPESHTEETIIATTTEEVIETTIKTSTTTSPTTTSTTTSTTTVSSTPETREDEGPATPATTNFTCKNKELEQFYPDIETGCKNFHYCSPGFKEDEILDLSFVCSGDTRFDIVTKKCQDINAVECSANASSVTTTTLSSTTESTTTTSTSTTTPVATTFSSSTTESTTTTLESETEIDYSTTESTEDGEEVTTHLSMVVETDSPSARSDLLNNKVVKLESTSVDAKIGSQTTESAEKGTSVTTDVDTVTELYTESSSNTDPSDALHLMTEMPVDLEESTDEIIEIFTESNPSTGVDSLISEISTEEINTADPSTESEPEKTTSLQKLLI